MTNTMAPWISTHSGGRFDLIHPRRSVVDPRDIARALANTCRYGGHPRRYYSVAEHCVLMVRAAIEMDTVAMAPGSKPTPRDLFAVLHHDSGEAYYGDIVAPLKSAIDSKMAEYGYDVDVIGELMVGVDRSVRRALGIHAIPAWIHTLDQRIRVDEMKQLFRDDSGWDFDGVYPLGVEIIGWSPERAEYQFLAWHDLLVRQIGEREAMEAGHA